MSKRELGLGSTGEIGGLLPKILYDFRDMFFTLHFLASFGYIDYTFFLIFTSSHFYNMGIL